jgi:hypothetical protein
MPLSPGAAHRQQQLEHLRQARKQKQAEREARCLSGKPPKGPSAAGQGLAARRSHNAGVRATTQVCFLRVCAVCVHAFQAPDCGRWAVGGGAGSVGEHLLKQRTL